jgi:hypothetical protein
MTVERLLGPFFEAFLRQTRALRVKPADLGGEFLGTNCVLGDI